MIILPAEFISNVGFRSCNNNLIHHLKLICLQSYISKFRSYKKVIKNLQLTLNQWSLYQFS